MNIEELKSYLNCDDAFLISLMDKFVEEVVDITKKIKTATSNKDWATVKINAHKMLSSVRIFEMQEIISILEKIEIESEGEKNAYIIEQDVEKLSGLVERVIYDVKIGLNKIKTSE